MDLFEFNIVNQLQPEVALTVFIILYFWKLFIKVQALYSWHQPSDDNGFDWKMSRHALETDMRNSTRILNHLDEHMQLQDQVIHVLEKLSDKLDVVSHRQAEHSILLTERFKLR